MRDEPCALVVYRMAETGLTRMPVVGSVVRFAQADGNGLAAGPAPGAHPDLGSRAATVVRAADSPAIWAQRGASRKGIIRLRTPRRRGRISRYSCQRGVQLRQLPEVARNMRSRILVLSGRPNDARELSQMLQGLPVILDFAENLQQARAKLLQDGDYQAILNGKPLSPTGNGWICSIWSASVRIRRKWWSPVRTLTPGSGPKRSIWASMTYWRNRSMNPRYGAYYRNACARRPQGSYQVATV